jgi:putative FmdB family regulatory protein
MPLYEYQCTKCGHVTEFLESSSAKKTHVCEKCGSKNMKKVLSVFSARSAGVGSSGTDSSCPTGTCAFS